MTTVVVIKDLDILKNTLLGLLASFIWRDKESMKCEVKEPAIGVRWRAKQGNASRRQVMCGSHCAQPRMGHCVAGAGRNRGLLSVAWCEQILGARRPKFFVSIATRLSSSQINRICSCHFSFSLCFFIKKIIIHEYILEKRYKKSNVLLTCNYIRRSLPDFLLLLSLWLFSAASYPSLFLRLISATCSTRYSTIPKWPFWAARCNRVFFLFLSHS